MLRRTGIKVGKLPESKMPKPKAEPGNAIKPKMVDDKSSIYRNVIKMKRERENG